MPIMLCYLFGAKRPRKVVATSQKELTPRINKINETAQIAIARVKPPKKTPSPKICGSDEGFFQSKINTSPLMALINRAPKYPAGNQRNTTKIQIKTSINDSPPLQNF